MGGRKFDLRIYIVIFSLEPLVIYMNNKGLARITTEDFEQPCKENLKNRYIHLTNYSVNKYNQNSKLEFKKTL